MSRIGSRPRGAGSSSARHTSLERRQEIVSAAFDILAECGFEHLRTRAVADRVGINIATLHYHFASKEDLIAAVCLDLCSRYMSDAAPPAPVDPALGVGLAALRRELRNSRYWRLKRPMLVTVTREFALRALRDPALARILKKQNQEWRRQLVELFMIGVEEGVFRAGLDPDACATLLMSFLWGASPILGADIRAFDRACVELEVGLLSERGRKLVRSSAKGAR